MNFLKFLKEGSFALSFDDHDLLTSLDKNNIFYNREKLDNGVFLYKFDNRYSIEYDGETLTLYRNGNKITYGAARNKTEASKTIDGWADSYNLSDTEIPDDKLDDLTNKEEPEEDNKETTDDNAEPESDESETNSEEEETPKKTNESTTLRFKDFLLLEDGEAAIASGDSTVPATVSVEPGNTTSNIDTFSLPIGMKRIDMPQIQSNCHEEFKNDLKINNISLEKHDAFCSDLTPTQSEFNMDKVQSIKDSMSKRNYIDDPILISNDNMIVDGHHRWKAKDQDDIIAVNRVGLNFDELYDFLQNKPYVFRRKIDQ
jgi:hypothetical protein